MNNNVYAQHQFYNLNIRNGLPSNHVYRTIVDHNGYLWIATDKGIVKYNGYTTKIFDISSGITNDDIWNLFEDTKGRMWLACISDNMGYIFKDKYHKAVILNPTKLYPRDFINNSQGGIIFKTGDQRYLESICYELNDTINCFQVRKKIKAIIARDHLNRELGALTYNKGILFSVFFDWNKFKYYQYRKTQIDNLHNLPIMQGNFIFPERKVTADDTFIVVMNMKTGASRRICMLADEELIQGIEYQKQLYFTTTQNAYRIDENINILDHFDAKWQKNNNIKFLTFMNHAEWKTCISTTNRGLIIIASNNQFIDIDSISKRGKYVGDYHDSIFYWWNQESKTLFVKNANGVTSNKYPSIGFIHKIIHQNADSALILADDDTYNFIFGAISRRYAASGMTTYEVVNDTIYHELPKNVPWSIPYKYQDCIIDSNKTAHVVMFGFKYCTISIKSDSCLIKTIDNDRYEQIIYYPPTNSYIVRGKDQILIETNNQFIKINNKQLALLGISNLQQILNDSFGNIFIKCREQLLCYSPKKRKLISLLKNYNLNGTTIHLRNKMLIATGKFGIITLNITGDASIVKPVLIPNFKGQNYSVINDAYMLDTQVVLNTDMGIYSVNINTTDTENTYHFFASHVTLHATTYNYDGKIRSNDTIKLIQTDLQLSFDLINPYGNGIVKYNYSIDGKNQGRWTTANDVSLPIVEPGKYHILKVTMADDSWRSNTYTLYLYVQPFWWQTNTGKTWLSILSLLVISAISFITILATKYILNKRHTKENKYLELELKSIYAQLNPHFIFNTLSNIIYYIKKDRKNEAYKYLNSFSKLLRSYIKSSRNKWLPLSEEIETIENYILLQMVRFENKFDYTINIDTGLDTEKTLLPSLLLQPLVENAIHHGLQQKQEKGMLTLSFKKTNSDNVIIITIEDDGIGRIKAKEFSKNSPHKKESFGSNLIEDLITIYKRYELFSIDIDYYDKQSPDTGTIVTLTIKSEAR